MIIQADILEWAKQYDGEPFHALLCDPPYHLTEIGRTLQMQKGSINPRTGKDRSNSRRTQKGFMGKDWDGGDIAFRPETWAALAEHLYPGAWGMAFSGSRGWHRMAVAIEDAGLLIQPTIFCWVYGCLSEDTEILTSNGWERYHKAIENSTVMCYNPDTDALEWHAVQELFAYGYDDTAYRIHSDHTDQLVSRNHRCLVERGGKYVFQRAETLQSKESVPVLESVPSLPYDLLSQRQRRIQPKSILLQGLRQTSVSRSATSPQSRPSAHGRGHCLSGLRQRVLQASGMASQEQAAFLLAFLSGETRNRTDFDSEQIRSNGHALPWYGPEGHRQSSMEGRRNLLQETWQLSGREVRALPSRVYRHGPQGWLCDGASLDGRTGHWAPPLALRSGTPQRSQPGAQRVEQLSTVRKQPRSQTIRASRIARSDLATVTPVHYRGIVWCVRVPTGAFVARRNGQIFITGNSGFPKATRIDTQVDRRAGATRETVGTRKHQPKFAAAELGYREKDNGYNSKERLSFDVTAPATELAQAWAGHRYGGQALKPAIEPVIVFQKPYAGRPIDSITRTGAGALNIDGGRIPANGESLSGGMVNGTSKVGHEGWDRPWRHDPDAIERNKKIHAERIAHAEESGRWPANFVLAHHPACNGACVEDCPVRRLGEQSGVDSSRPGATKPRSSAAFDGGWAPEIDGASHDDTGTAARYFYNADWMAERLETADQVGYYAKASKSERENGLDPAQIDLLRVLYGTSDEEFEESTINDGRKKSIDNPYQRGETTRRNIHPTVKPISLAVWLAKLLLPPAEYAPRRLLIPFCGVASEYIGAMLAGWEEVVGVELEAEHVAIGNTRINWWQAMMRQTHSSDPGAILKTYGMTGKAKPSSTERWPAGSLFEMLEEE